MSRTTMTPEEATWLHITQMETPTGPDDDLYSSVEHTWVWVAGTDEHGGASGWEFKTLAAALEHALKWARGE